MTTRRGNMDKFIDQPLLCEVGTTVYVNKRLANFPVSAYLKEALWLKLVRHVSDDNPALVVFRKRDSYYGGGFSVVVVKVSRQAASIIMNAASPSRKSSAKTPDYVQAMNTVASYDADGNIQATNIRSYLDGVRASRAERSQHEAGNDRGIL